MTEADAAPAPSGGAAPAPGSGEASPPTAERSASAPPAWRRAALWGAKILVSGAALWWTFSRIDARSLVDHVRSTPVLVLVAAVGLTVANLLVGALRWRALALAYGADRSRLPSVLALFRLYLHGLFYNTFLPGNVGGDVLRAWALGRALSNPAAAGMVVLLERILGLAGLAVVAALAATMAAIPAVELRGWAVLALIATVLGVAALSALPSFATRLPGSLGRMVARLPRLVQPSAFAAALVLSVGTQLLAAYTGHLLLQATCGHALDVVRSLAVVPITVLASYFPFTVAGLGAREAAFVSLAGQLGVEPDAATAASLLLLASTLVVALAGGLVALLPAASLTTTTPRS